MKKQCTKCKKIKLESSFTARPNGRLQSWCKLCYKKYNKKYRKENSTRKIPIDKLHKRYLAVYILVRSCEFSYNEISDYFGFSGPGHIHYIITKALKRPAMQKLINNN